jgi:hypothetical protein
VAIPEIFTMTERNELPKGWQFIAAGQRSFRAYRMKAGGSLTTTAWCASRQIAAMLAWRIVDAEKETADGR